MPSIPKVFGNHGINGYHPTYHQATQVVICDYVATVEVIHRNSHSAQLAIGGCWENDIIHSNCSFDKFLILFIDTIVFATLSCGD